MASFDYTCPFCKETLECNDSLNNKAILCPSCKKRIFPKNKSDRRTVKKSQKEQVQYTFNVPRMSSSSILEVIGYINFGICVLTLLTYDYHFTDIKDFMSSLFLLFTAISPVFISGCISLIAANVIKHTGEICCNTEIIRDNSEEILKNMKQEQQQ